MSPPLQLPPELWTLILLPSSSSNEYDKPNSSTQNADHVLTPTDLWLRVRGVNRLFHSLVTHHFRTTFLPAVQLRLAILMPSYDVRNPGKGRATFGFRSVSLPPNQDRDSYDGGGDGDGGGGGSGGIGEATGTLSRIVTHGITPGKRASAEAETVRFKLLATEPDLLVDGFIETWRRATLDGHGERYLEGKRYWDMRVPSSAVTAAESTADAGSPIETRAPTSSSLPDVGTSSGDGGAPSGTANSSTSSRGDSTNTATNSDGRKSVYVRLRGKRAFIEGPTPDTGIHSIPAATRIVSGEDTETTLGPENVILSFEWEATLTHLFCEMGS